MAVPYLLQQSSAILCALLHDTLIETNGQHPIGWQSAAVIRSGGWKRWYSLTRFAIHLAFDAFSAWHRHRHMPILTHRYMRDSRFGHIEIRPIITARIQFSHRLFGNRTRSTALRLRQCALQVDIRRPIHALIIRTRDTANGAVLRYWPSANAFQ